MRQIARFDKLHLECSDAAAPLEPIDRSDVRMVQGREHFRLAPETRKPLRVAGQRRGQDLCSDWQVA